jgi:AraC-like DNA-binding protein
MQEVSTVLAIDFSSHDTRLDLTNAPMSLQCVALVVRRLRLRGLPAAKVLEGTGVAADMLNAPTCVIKRSQELAVLENALRLTGDRAIGLEIGAEMRLTSYGILGFAMLLSPTLLDALKVAFKFSLLLGNYLRLRLRVEQGEAILSVSDYIYQRNLEVLNTDLALASLWKMLSELLGEPCEMISVQFRASSPGDSQVYTNTFRCPVSFGKQENALRFRKELLARSLPFAEPVSWYLAYQQCMAVENEWRLAAGDDVVAQVLRLLRGDPKRFNSLVVVAAALNMSERSFRRHLTAKGTRFQLLFDQAVLALAKDFLATTTLSVDEIAHRLGYNDASGFRQAFKRMLGQSPRQFRLSQAKKSGS